MLWYYAAKVKTQATGNLLRPIQNGQGGHPVQGSRLWTSLQSGPPLNGSKKSLDRFRFRHDSVLTYLVDKIVFSKPKSMEVYADLNGWKVNGGMVPSDLVATGQIPDIVLLYRAKKTIVLLELTCPFDSSPTSFKSSLDEELSHNAQLG